MPRIFFAFFWLILLGAGQPAASQTASDLAALEARLMAKLEQRIAEEGSESRGQIDALRISFQQTVKTLAESKNTLDRKALVAIDAGATADGVAVLEERARARDTAINQNTSGPPSIDQRTQRATEWKQIGALAFLDSTDRAISAYRQALQFSPEDAEVLDQLAELYGRQAKWSEVSAIGEQMTRLSTPEYRVEGFYHIADAHLEQSEPSKARTNTNAGLGIARANGLTRLIAKGLAFAAAADVLDGKFASAEKLVAEAWSIARQGNYKYEEVIALYIGAVSAEQKASMSLLGRQGALKDVDEKYAAVEAAMLSIDERVGAAGIKINRGRVTLRLGDEAKAESLLRTAIADLKKLGATGRLAYADLQLGNVLLERGDLNAAISLFESSVRSSQQTRQPGYQALALMSWARAEAARKNNQAACDLAQESVRVLVAGAPEITRQHQAAKQQAARLCR